uniref:lamin-B1-like isoform X2 n=1 Tax=Styela clava TaxID=7725 RepID=UPI00193ABF41|nr:lamin-B1-like isoform X2 [Styela clava]
MSTPRQQSRRKEQSRQQGSPSTPLSPSVTSRREEKDQMINLNNRLAAYIEKIRSLETENRRLQIQVTSHEETSSREVSNIKEMYETEIKEARRLLDEVAKERAQLQLEVASLQDRSDSEKIRADGLEHDNSVLEGKLKDASKRLRAKEAQTANALKERDDAVAQLDSFKAKVNDLAQELETTRKTLESETLQRIEYQNKLQSLQEDLQFKEKLWKEEVRESRRRHDVSVTEIDENIKVDYESRLEAAIADLRDQQNYEIDQMRDDLESQYKAKIESARAQVDSTRKLLTQLQEGSKSSQMKIDRFQTTIRSLESENKKLLHRIGDLEGQLEAAIELKRAAVAVVEEERDELRSRLDEMETEYAELLNLKLHLDMEISTYRKLLEEEEARLNISPGQTESDSKLRTRAARRKRKRVGQTESQEISMKQQKQDTSSSASASAGTTTITRETVTVEQTTRQRSTLEGEPQSEGEKSCVVM